MSLWIAPALLSAALMQAPPTQTLPPDEDAKPQTAKPGTKPPSVDSDLPPDEDAAPPETFTFNPVKSKKSIEVGEFYFHKGDYKAAASRFRDATQWNQGNADAWLRLGDAEDKRGQPRAARVAYQKYLELASNSKNAAEVRKKLERLK